MNRKGFTLIELMIVVAIIGILAAIAIPNFLAMQLRAKRAELPANLDGLRTAEKAYHAEWDVFTSAAATPSTAPTRTPLPFDDASGGYDNFDQLGWVADGKVRGQYQVVATAGNFSTDAFVGTALGDIDGDTTKSNYKCDRATKGAMISDNNVY